MFADDTTLVAKSRQALISMLQDMKVALADIGLNLNADKCSIQRTSTREWRKTALRIGGSEYPIVSSEEGFKILGTNFTLNGSTKKEVQSRLDAGWAKFHALLPLLGKRDASILKRLKLCDATVSKTVLWCSESWSLIVKEKRLLRSTWRKMLRKIIGPRRMQDED